MTRVLIVSFNVPNILSLVKLASQIDGCDQIYELD